MRRASGWRCGSASASLVGNTPLAWWLVLTLAEGAEKSLTKLTDFKLKSRSLPPSSKGERAGRPAHPGDPGRRGTEARGCGRQRPAGGASSGSGAWCASLRACVADLNWHAGGGIGPRLPPSCAPAALACRWVA
jgi:hypothetical protein